MDIQLINVDLEPVVKRLTPDMIAVILMYIVTLVFLALAFKWVLDKKDKEISRISAKRDQLQEELMRLKGNHTQRQSTSKKKK